MKKLLLLMSVGLLSNMVNAQNTTNRTTTATSQDSTITTTTTSKKVNVKFGQTNTSKSASFGLGIGIGLGWNRFMDKGSIGTSSSNANLSLEKGPELILTLLQGHVDLVANHRLRASTSLGVTYNTYHFEKPITLLKGQDQLTIVSDNRHYDKNLLRSTYLTMPLVLSFRPARSSSFSISAGIEGGLLLSGKTKQITDEDGKKKLHGSFNLNPSRYGFMVGMGYRDFGIYAKYYMSDVFANNQGPKDLKTVSIGVCAGLW